MQETVPPTAKSESDRWAANLEAQMTEDERFSLLVSVMGVNPINPVRDSRIPDGATLGAGYVPGVPRLGIPALQMSDASLGITNPGYREGDTATALPATLVLGASFNRQLAREAGAMLGREARVRGFNVLLGGGMNLARDPRNGRNFEYISEDVLLSAAIAAEMVIGTQSEGVISTLKHFSLNANEHNRHWLDAVIDPVAHRESDLLAFELAIDLAQPGSVMGAYNKVNGAYACGNEVLLNDILKQSWGFAGWVMSDWGAVHSWEYALKGLDQESGSQLDAMMNGGEWFGSPLRQAYAEGKLSKARLSEMVRRMLRSIHAIGLHQLQPQPEIDLNQHNQVALEIARQGIVLLKNDGVLPLTADKSIALIGGYAQLGVVTGAGSSAVLPAGGYAAQLPIGGEGILAGARKLYLLPSSPLAELHKALPDTLIRFDPGMYTAQAAALAKTSDVAIVMVIRPDSEAFDAPDLSLPWGQDALIEAVAAANPNTIVVLQTGNPIAMPWQNSVKGIVEAWFPGQAGGTAIADVLTGKVNPCGRLPMTFPADIEQTPRPEAPGIGTPWGTPITVNYHEGADVGYRWFGKKDLKPLYAFGYGLSYTTFALSGLTLTGGDTITARFTVRNTGDRPGATVPQLYLQAINGVATLRLIGFDRVNLQPQESREVSLTVDPRLLASFDGDKQQWQIDGGTYTISLSDAADAIVETAETTLTPQHFGH